MKVIQKKDGAIFLINERGINIWFNTVSDLNEELQKVKFKDVEFEDCDDLKKKILELRDTRVSFIKSLLFKNKS